MLIPQQITSFKSLNTWFESPLGQLVANAFIKELEPASGYLKGEVLLQLGCCAANRWLDLLEFKYKWVASPYHDVDAVNLMCSLDHTPLSRNSVDCILVPLVLEPFISSYSLIDEIDRVLKPMGYVIFLNVNPWSLWGLAMKCNLLPCFAGSEIKMHTPFHLSRIFFQRGYRQCMLNNFCYIPPINNQRLLTKLTFLNEMGKMLWPFPSGFYSYVAQKYEKIGPTLSPQLVQPPAEQPMQIAAPPA